MRDGRVSGVLEEDGAAGDPVLTMNPFDYNRP